MLTKEIVYEALAILGENGENWGQGGSGKGRARGPHCLSTATYDAIEDVSGRGVGDQRDYAKDLGFNSVQELYNWNDEEGRTFEEVKQRLLGAIKNV